MCFLRRRSQQRLEVGQLHGRERRGSCRYPAAIPSALLIWGSPDSPHQDRVRIENISIEGAKLTGRAGPKNQPGLRVRLVSPAIDMPDGVEGEIVSSRRSLLGVRAMRIRFLAPLTFLAFQRLVHGPEWQIDRRTVVPEHERDYYWR